MKSRSLKLLALLVLAGSLAGDAGAQRAVIARHKRSNSPAPPVVIPVLLNDPVEIIRRSAKNEEQDARRGHEFNYSEMTLEEKLDGSGAIKSSESHTKQVLVVNGDRLERVVAKNGAPLPVSDAAKEEEKIRLATHKYATETAQERATRLKVIEKSREDERGLVEDVQQAYNFTLLPPEEWHGHTCYVIQADPKPGFQPRSKDGKYLSKFRGTIWVAQKELQWAKVDLEMVDTISFGWFVARLNKGTHVEVEQARVAGDVWLPTQAHVRMQGRVALVQDVNYDVTRIYRDYQDSSLWVEVSKLSGSRSSP
jgi:hypothetical protein